MNETTAPLSSFERMLGRATTERERDQLRRVQAELDLRENDALWLVIFALQYYEGLYRQFPKAIAAEAQRVLSETRATAEATIRAGAESAKADLAKAIAITAREVARDVARRQMIQWLVVGMLLGAGLLGAGIFIGAHSGI
ncbi:hypothetical protein OGR47_21550 (plasmid) [Methylocystis sp. MJC1]|uniref:hypothetical protein n=1 Tax=Methylocystis sp. MJC1 TaxID=2654282 RepID=UPI0013EA34DE|nr:hypothetical protein [Methylocystis sp. MJC1]KAF2991410.1 hypothetical protein MJC1_01398 [Methylocystis sp. MJC1]MBU6529476.1 hypothetical protein [Methylocystis sp. MJC1]UZX14248.1 hypothetical protein OGR47_21550 [Methylocystis sp. MJC1]